MSGLISSLIIKMLLHVCVSVPQTMISGICVCGVGLLRSTCSSMCTYKSNLCKSDKKCQARVDCSMLAGNIKLNTTTRFVDSLRCSGL